MMNTIIGVLLPFIGTTLGAAMVFFLRNEISPRLQKTLLGFASGVMMAASVWSLLIPSIDIATEQGVTAWLPAATGFVGGMLFLLLLDTLIPHLHINSDEEEGLQSKLGRSAKLMLAVTLHNIPEGMAVGVVLAGALAEGSGIHLQEPWLSRSVSPYRTSPRGLSSRCRSRARATARANHSSTACSRVSLNR